MQFLRFVIFQVLYNLGLIHLNTGQNASAFNYLSAAVSIIGGVPKCAMALMLLGVALTNLEDKENARKCYQSAIGFNDDEPLIPLNYAAFSYQNVSELISNCIQRTNRVKVIKHNRA